MAKLLIILALAALGVAASYVIGRRRPAAQVATASPLPSHVERSGFVAPEAPWLLAVFSSATCLACEDVWRHVQGFERSDVAITDIEVKAEPDLHRVYNIDSVPSTLLVDSMGIVHNSFVGPLSPADLDTISAALVTGS